MAKNASETPLGLSSRKHTWVSLGSTWVSLATEVKTAPGLRGAAPLNGGFLCNELLSGVQLQKSQVLTRRIGLLCDLTMGCGLLGGIGIFSPESSSKVQLSAQQYFWKQEQFWIASLKVHPSLYPQPRHQLNNIQGNFTSLGLQLTLDMSITHCIRKIFIESVARQRNSLENPQGHR